jgi:hypothetical protein
MQVRLDAPHGGRRIVNKRKDQSMGKTEEYSVELEPLFYDPRNAAELARRLVAESNLPSPRANLELAEAFAEAVSIASVFWWLICLTRDLPCWSAGLPVRIGTSNRF